MIQFNREKLGSKLFDQIVQFASEPEDTDEWRLRKTIGVIAAGFGSVAQIGYGLLFLSFNEKPTGYLLMGFGLIIILDLILYHFHRNYAVFYSLSISTPLLSPFIATLLLGGFAKTGMSMIWCLLAPLLTLISSKPRQSVYWFGTVLVLFITAGVLQPYLRTSNNIPVAVNTALFAINVSGAATFIFLTLYYYVWQNRILMKLLHEEQEKAEDLLLNILPKDIADILKNEKRIIADDIEGASILFADVVNFTPLSAQLSPTELVGLLNDVFSYCDTLVEKYNVEKIKTIGDCYMIAAGVPKPRADHATVLVRLALEFQNYIRQHTFNNGIHLQFRLGINSGPVVAGVIGRKKFIYDLWGDTVNTASRMESNGSGGFIQVTESTYALIKDNFVCEPRGVIHIKGKGDMPVWFVISEKEDLNV